MIEKETFDIVNGVFEVQHIIKHREAFGWVIESFDSSHVYGTRDQSIPNYEQLRKLELKYIFFLAMATEAAK